MLPVLEVYQKIFNKDNISQPSEVRTMLVEILKSNNHTQDDVTMMEIAYSFYKLGFENKNKSKHPVSL